jgi:hypothetical protein
LGKPCVWLTTLAAEYAKKDRSAVRDLDRSVQADDAPIRPDLIFEAFRNWELWVRGVEPDQVDTIQHNT